ncbi:HNH endonuclease signature motif containing protein, partial [Corynebacterium diphtheriae]|uniref:HNH endonuclease signature motif containing protein n=1 Tax=Corynebacterium diphtheriae TaxID=1717 RepID=UPI003C12FBC9
QWCDIDHVEEYDLGGVTGAVNAQCLCRHHHNVKTSRRVDCEIGAGGVVTWQIGDRRVVTTPEGVLAGQTFTTQRKENQKSGIGNATTVNELGATSVKPASIT